MKRRFKKSEKIVSRRVAHEFILVPICRSTKEVESIYTLNEVAARIWELIDGEKTIDSIARKIIDEFDVSEKDAQSDIRELVNDLEKINALERVL